MVDAVATALNCMLKSVQLSLRDEKIVQIFIADFFTIAHNADSDSLSGIMNFNSIAL